MDHEKLRARRRYVSYFGTLCGVFAMMVFISGCPTADTGGDGTPTPECDADNPCADDGDFCNGAESCNADGDCESAGDPCDTDAGEVCNEDADRCDACDQAGQDDCEDDDACTDDACVEGQCAFTATDVAAACDDDDVCNGTETCDATTGDCVDGDALVCEDGLDCTNDSCDAADGCIFADNCDAGEECDADTGTCLPTEVPAESDLTATDPDTGEELAVDADGVAVVFDALVVGDVISLISPTPPTGMTRTVPADCTCAWTVTGTPPAGTFDPADDCVTDFTLDEEGDFTITVVVTCADGDTTFNQDGTAEAAPAVTCTVETEATDCDDLNPCTTDTCDADGLCVNTDMVCVDDGEFCNGPEVCDPADGVCGPAGDPCADTVCDEDNDTCGVTGTTFTLTTSTDNPTLTDDDDTVTGVVDTATTHTLSVGDNIDGLDGNDRLEILMASLDYSPVATIANIESFFLNNVSGSTRTFNMANTTGVVTVWANKGLNALVLSNLLEMVDLGILRNNEDLTANYDNTVFSATDDNVTIQLDDAQHSVSSSDVMSSASTILLASSGSNGPETLTFNSVGDKANGVASITATDTGTTDDHTTINVTGTQDLRVGAIGDQITTIVASTFGGKLDIDVTNSDAKDMTITGSPQDDIFRTSGTNINDTINGGLGNDTMIQTIATTGTKRGTFDSVETAKLAFSAAGTFRVSDATGLTLIEVETSTAAPTLSQLVDGTNVKVSGDVTGALTVDYAAAQKADATCTIGGSKDVAITGVTTFDKVQTLSVDTTGTKSSTFAGIALDDDLTTDVTIANSSGSTLVTGAVTQTSKMTAFSASATTKNTTVASLAECEELTDLTLTANDATCSIGAIGGGAAAAKLERVTMTGTTDGIFTTTGTLDATGADIGSMSFSTAEDSGNNAIARINADTIASIDCTIADDSTLTFADFDMTDALGISSLSATGAGNLVITQVQDAATDIVDINCSQLTGTAALDLSTSAIDSAMSVTLGNGGTAGTGVLCTAATAAVTFTSGSGNDTFVGGTVGDTIGTGGGNDSITGGLGADTITPGSGNDTIHYTSTADIDVLNGFATTEDQIALLQGTFALEDAGGDDVYTGADEYLELARAAGACVAGDFDAANDIIVLTDATGFTTAEVDTCIDQGVVAGDAIIVFYNSATSLVTMAYDPDIDAAGGQLIFSTFDIAVADIAASFAAGDFITE